MLNTVNHASAPFLVTGLTATGSSQSTAFQLANNALHEFTTVGASTGAILPIAELPSIVAIYNRGASTLTLYPAVGGAIDEGSTNATVSISAGTGVTYWAASPTLWYDLQTASGGGGGGGTVTQITAGAGLSGGVITGLGTIALLAPTLSVLGGVLAVDAVSHQWVSSISTSGVPVLTQPAFTDISGVADVAQLPSTGLVITQAYGDVISPADGATINIDLSLGNVFLPAPMAGNRALALLNAPSSQPFARPFTIFLVQDGTGSRTITSWFSGFTIRWAGGCGSDFDHDGGQSGFSQLCAVWANVIVGHPGGG